MLRVRVVRAASSDDVREIYSTCTYIIITVRERNANHTWHHTIIDTSTSTSTTNSVGLLRKALKMTPKTKSLASHVPYVIVRTLFYSYSYWTPKKKKMTELFLQGLLVAGHTHTVRVRVRVRYEYGYITSMRKSADVIMCERDVLCACSTDFESYGVEVFTLW